MNERGSHVGMILSFVIFITFVVFIYSIIRPNLTMGEDKRTTLEYIEKKITENISNNLTIASISIISGSGLNCIKLNDFVFYSKTGDRDIVKNGNQQIQSAYVYALGTFNYLEIDRTSTSDRFFKVYSSSEFNKLPAPPGEATCEALAYEEGYEIGSINSGRYIFKKDMLRLKDYYNSSYENLKNEFKIPPGNEFGFDFIESNGTVTQADQKIKEGNVFADKFPIQYIDEEANILSGFINIKIW
jgi:hypothetical protein